MTTDDQVTAWIEARCMLDPDAQTPQPDLYADFVEWARQQAKATASSRAFALALTRRGIKIGRQIRGGPRCRAGIRLAEPTGKPLDLGREWIPLRGVMLEPNPGPRGPKSDEEEAFVAAGPRVVATFPAPEPEPTPTATAPDHLSEPARAWWVEVNAEYQLDTHQRMQLTEAAQAWDESQHAGRELRDAGSLVYDSLQGPKPRPEVAIKDKAARRFMMLCRELGLNLAEAAAPRGPKAQAAKERR